MNRYSSHPSPATQSTSRAALCLSLALCTAAWLLPAGQAQAQDWPSKPVQVVVPFPAGGPLDIVARAISETLANKLGQPFVVDNRAGATGNIGAATVARAKPDGHTVLITLGTSLTANPAIYPTMNFSVAKDLQAVATLSRFSMLLAVHPSTEIKTWADYTRAVMQDSFNYGSAGQGSPGHLTMAVLADAMKAKATHIPYKGNAPVVAALVGGQINSAFVALPGLLPHVQGGSLLALAVSGSERSKLMPDVPTTREHGFPDSAVDMTFVMAVPTGTPQAIINQLNREAHAALQQPEVAERLRKIDIEAVGDTPAQAAERLRVDTARWARVAKDAGIAAE